MKYSNSTKNFYPNNIDYPAFPDDIIEVTQAYFDAAMMRQPGETLDVVNGQLIIVPKPAATLEELKIDRINEITAAFKNELSAGFVTSSGIKMDADITDVQLLKSAYDLIVLMKKDSLPLVVDYNNAPHVDMPLTDVIALMIEVAVNYQTLYAKKQTLRGLVMAAADATELDAITW
jgi:hypothetical protein